MKQIFLLWSSLIFLSCFNARVAGGGRKLFESPAGENPFTPKDDLPKPEFLPNKASSLTAVESATFSKLADQHALSTHSPTKLPAGENLFTPKAYLIRYWKKQVSNDLPIPEFLLDKASPLTAVESETFLNLADQNALSTHLPEFCSSAKLLCFPDVSPSLEKNDQNVYGVNNTFKDYANKNDVPFASYQKKSSAKLDSLKQGTDNPVNKWVEKGMFFREKMLKKGTVIPMPDMRDKMPKRSFLPRVLSTKLPFSTSKLSELKKIFHAVDNSSMAGMLAGALSECERVPSQGETKRCVASVEDMLDFATSVLGRNVVVRSTENTKGSMVDVMIGPVKGINRGKATKSVSCYQIVYPYLTYYCHLVPKIRVYEADLLDPKSKARINRGVAICHVDTSDWSASYGAFAALRSSPGKIEVCHWIFENDMNWAIAD